eukprot:COSAG06_NODE_59134_length_275_cov_0.585227_1_plen_52_part_01
MKFVAQVLDESMLKKIEAQVESTDELLAKLEAKAAAVRDNWLNKEGGQKLLD